MIKTRIRERRQGTRVEMMPQYLKTIYNFLGNVVLSKKWVDMKSTPYASSDNKESVQILRVACEERIDSFLMDRGQYEEIIHWYPEVQK